MKKSMFIICFVGVLSFIAGFINVYGLITFGSTLTHFTGDLSKSAIIFSNNFNFLVLFKAIDRILLFILGNIIAGILIGERNFVLRKRYGLVFIAISLFVFASYILFIDTKIFKYILAFVVGIQNGLFVTYRGVLTRTSHMSGNLSDIGVHIGYKIKGIKFDNLILYYYFLVVFLFFLGGFFSNILYSIYGNTTILLVPILYFFIGLFYIIFKYHLSE